MLTLASKHAELAQRFASIASGVTDWDAPTPVQEWKARDVVSHLTDWLPGMLAGLGIDLAQATEADPVARWVTHSANLQALLEDDDLLERPVNVGGQEQPFGQMIDNFYLADVFMHSWDLAKSSGQDAGWDPEVAGAMAEGMGQMREMLAASGQFGTPVALDDSHTPEERLAAIIGRDPHWAP